MKKLLIGILLILGGIGISNIGVEAKGNTERIEEVGNQFIRYIGSHIEEFKEAYNRIEKKSLEATGIEGYSLVYIVDTKEYGVYIDFNEDKGYMVSSFGLKLYEIETEGDIEYLKEEKLIYYSIIDGFLWKNQEGYHKYGVQTRQAETVYGYAGQAGNADADIFHLDEYVADRYPSYTLEVTHNETKTEGGYSPTDMYRTSYYLKYITNDGGYTYHTVQTEGNCALTAIFNILSSWKQMGYFDELPLKDVFRNVREEIKEDPGYEQYGTGQGGVGIDSYWTTHRDNYLQNVHELYYWVRYFAVAAKGYTPESGFTTEQSKGLISLVTGHYRNMTFAKTSENFADVKDSLDAGRAVFMGVRNSTTFGGNHAVALLGYSQYSYTTGVWIFSKTHTAYFFMIDDGHTEAVTYLDPNCNSNLSYEFIYV